MGVLGLTSYVENNKHFLHSFKVKNTDLVVDGCSLYYRLFFNSELDLMHGGDYDAFALLTRNFFDTLYACGIRPFVVLDGGLDHSEKKFKTVKERLQSKIKEAQACSRGGSAYILPLLTKEVFVQVLDSLRVPFVQCVSEADWEIAALANQWGCAVLTNDSDFYIFDLRGGYLPLSYFQWRGVAERRGGAERHVRASRFSADRFCAHFGHMNKELLPLFAVITGNDYTGVRGTERLFAHIPLGGTGQGGRLHARIDGLLRWLSRFARLEDAVEETLELLGGHKDAARTQLTSGMRDYQLSEGRLASFFAGGAPTCGLPDPLDALPRWMHRALTEARLSSVLIDVLVLQRAMLYVQVENCSLPSSHSIAQPIRRVIYGLLLDWKGRRGQTQGSWRRGQTRSPLMNSTPNSVEEFDRHNLTLRRSSVPAAQSPQLKHLPLEKIHELSVPGRRQLLLETLGSDDDVTSAVPLTLGLAVSVTCYWLTNSTPRPRPQHVQALLLGLVYGELCRLSTTRQGPETEACGRLGQLRLSRGRRAGLDLDAAHLYSQWQSCMWASIHLNRLLGCPLLEPDCAWLYSGTLVHPILSNLQAGGTPENLLGGVPLARDLYQNLQGTVWRAVGDAFSSSSSSKKKKMRGRRPRVACGAAIPYVQDISNKFGMLELEDEWYDV